MERLGLDKVNQNFGTVLFQFLSTLHQKTMLVSLLLLVLIKNNQNHNNNMSLKHMENQISKAKTMNDNNKEMKSHVYNLKLYYISNL